MSILCHFYVSAAIASYWAASLFKKHKPSEEKNTKVFILSYHLHNDYTMLKRHAAFPFQESLASVKRKDSCFSNCPGLDHSKDFLCPEVPAQWPSPRKQSKKAERWTAKTARTSKQDSEAAVCNFPRLGKMPQGFLFSIKVIPLPKFIILQPMSIGCCQASIRIMMQSINPPTPRVQKRFALIAWTASPRLKFAATLLRIYWIHSGQTVLPYGYGSIRVFPVAKTKN